jgi:hypothetical protein
MAKPKLPETNSTRQVIFLGRGMTCDTGAFIFDIDAEVLRKLSGGAQHLYVTLRRLADGRSGELAINGNPLDWRYIARQAGMGRDLWQKYLRELRLAGLVWRKRERVPHYLDGRKRQVLGRAHYFVRRQAHIPENIKNQPILLMPDSPTVGESGTQYIQKHPEPYARVACAVDSPFKSGGETHTSSSKSTCKPGDDDFDIFCEPEAPEVLGHIDRIQTKAGTTLVNKGHDPDFVAEAIELIHQRAMEFGSSPATANYYVIAFEALMENSEEIEIVEASLRYKENLREAEQDDLREEEEQRKPKPKKKKDGGA